MKYCPKCGNKLEEENFICKNCGADLTNRIQKESLDREDLSLYADFIPRSLAWFIDITIVLVIVIPLSIYVNFGLFYIYSNVYLNIIGFFYFWLFETFNNGQTLGKKVFKIKAVDEKTRELAKPTQYFINNVTKATPFLVLDFILGLLVNFKSLGGAKKRLRITQNLTEITVIKLK